MSNLGKLLAHANKVCALLYFGGIAWLVLQNHPDFFERCYFSENALLPGLVASNFKFSESEIQNLNFDIADGHSKAGQEIEKHLTNSGLEVYKQDFAFRDDLVNARAQFKNGTNIYGIVRAARSASTECLVINIPLKPQNHNFASGVIVSLAKQMRKQFYWAKDIIFLFSEHGVFGARAWLNAYHGIRTPGITFSPLFARAGSIQAALSLSMEDDAVSYINLLVEGYNGQLPNLDLFNLVVRIVKLEGLPVAINHKFNPRNMRSLESFRAYIETSLAMMKQQASGKASGNHGEFLRHGIEALTIQTNYIPQWGSAGYSGLGRIIEGICRSLNNLLERFHQSFFFYVLPSTDNYISIGMYMPALGMVLAAVALKALSIIWGRKEKEAESSSEDKGAGDMESIDDLLKDMDSEYAENNPGDKNQQPSNMQQILLVIVASHACGVALFYSPLFIETWAQMFGCSHSSSLLLLMLTVQVAGAIFLPAFKLNPEVSSSLYVISLLQMGVIFGTVAIINFPFAMFVSVLYVFPTLLLDPSATRLTLLRKLISVLVSPLSVAAFICLFNSNGDAATLIQQLELFHTQLYENYHSQQGWLFSFNSLLLYPLWLQLWTVTNVQNDKQSKEAL